MIYSDNALPTTTFRTSDVSNLADAVFLGSGSLYTGALVKYEATNGAAIGGLVSGNYYAVIRSENGASIQLATRAADGTLELVALDPGVSASTPCTA